VLRGHSLVQTQYVYIILSLLSWVVWCPTPSRHSILTAGTGEISSFSYGALRAHPRRSRSRVILFFFFVLWCGHTRTPLDPGRAQLTYF
jgi:hypothetical protein